MIDSGSMVRLDERPVEHGRRDDGRHWIGADVTWVDHFGNLQLAATTADAEVAGVPSTGVVDLECGGLRRAGVRVVAVFADLAPGEVGLLRDANDHLALVAGRASASLVLSIGASDEVVVSW